MHSQSLTAKYGSDTYIEYIIFLNLSNFVKFSLYTRVRNAGMHGMTHRSRRQNNKQPPAEFWKTQHFSDSWDDICHTHTTAQRHQDQLGRLGRL